VVAVSGREFRLVAHSLPVVVWECDTAGVCAYMNARWTELTGQLAKDALGFGWHRLIHPDDLPSIMSCLKDAATHHAQASTEVRVFGAGEPRWVRLEVAPERLGSAHAGLVGVFIDINAARQAADDVLEREARLRLLEARNQTLLESVPDLIFRLDAEGRFLDFQPAPEADLFVPPSAFLGKRIDEVLPPAVAGPAQVALARVRETGAAHRFEYQLEVGGRVRDFEARLSPMRGGGSVSLVRDVTELKANERALIAATERAVTASSSKSQFLANVSHEIRTPLNGVIGVAQLLRTLELPPEAKEYVDVLEVAGESLLGLVNEVLDLSKIEADKLELKNAPFDLAVLVTHSARGFSTDARHKGIELMVEIDAHAHGVVVGDAERVRQIVNNLVGNAMKFTQSGRVTVRLSRASSASSLVVSDTGPGVPRAFQEAIFEPFVQAPGSRQGTGLGLSIARRLCQLMGGRLTLECPEGGGSVFEATLPLPLATHRVAPRPGPTTERRLRVLLAEDNEVNARLTRSMLSWLGHEVQVVGDGEAVLQALSASTFDVVLMDVHMPRLDGLTATLALRKAGRTVPVIALTANAMKGDEQACLAAGMNAYLAKPITVKALAELLGQYALTETER
jgi:PAS domain S-box-containing protein